MRFQKINVKGKVILVKSPERVHVKSRGEDVMKQNFVLADSSGICKGVIWEKTGFLKYKYSYTFDNVTVCSYSLSVSSNSIITEIEDIGEVNDEGSSVAQKKYMVKLLVSSGVNRITVVWYVKPKWYQMGKCGKCGLKVKN